MKIQYRIWDTEENRWIQDDDEVIGINNCGVIANDRQNMDDLSLLDGVEVQFYTGANDKNGRDIYDGDIVSYKGQVGRIEFFACMFICCWPDQTDDELSHMIIGDIEVIGNIFENPELLK
jgi:hypothetical protein